jgi:glyoxylase-like metal-dependent hydrolase (beta-lactamase superfamily II)
MTLPNYEVYALRFATTELRSFDAFLLKGDIHDGPLPLDFFIWVVRDDSRTIVVDTGFGDEASKRRNRPMIRHPVAALKGIGVDAATVADVVLTHLHYDHSGNAEFFSRATFHVQDSEVAYATGRHMCHHALSAASDVENVVDVVRNIYAGRVCFHDGDEEIAPGVSLHRTGGHTGGMQVVRVHTARGWVVLASDASHYYGNFQTGNPFPIVFNIGDVLQGNRILLKLADSPDHIIPGHDPSVLKRYPAHSADGENTVCVHLPPLADSE